MFELGARQAGAVLTQLGVQREQRVLLCMHDSRYLPMCFLGAIRAGIIPILANTMLTEADYEYMLQDSRASLVIVSAPLAPMFESLAARMPGRYAKAEASSGFLTSLELYVYHPPGPAAPSDEPTKLALEPPAAEAPDAERVDGGASEPSAPPPASPARSQSW